MMFNGPAIEDCQRKQEMLLQYCIVTMTGCFVVLEMKYLLDLLITCRRDIYLQECLTGLRKRIVHM